MFLKRWVLLLGGLLNGSELTVWRADLGTMLTNGLSGTTAAALALWELPGAQAVAGKLLLLRPTSVAGRSS